MNCFHRNDFENIYSIVVLFESTVRRGRSGKLCLYSGYSLLGDFFCFFMYTNSTQIVGE